MLRSWLVVALLVAAPAFADPASETAPRYSSHLLVLELAPDAVPAMWQAHAARAGGVIGTSGLLPIDHIANALGGVRLEPEFPGDAPRPGEPPSPFARFWLAHLPEGVTPDGARTAFLELADVENAWPSALGEVNAVPNDSLWTNSYYFYQANRRDIHAPEAWDITSGDSSIVVAIIDTGVIPYHPDLGAYGGHPSQISTNVAERDGIAGVDDDGNGYVDDVHGYDFVDLPNPYETDVVNGEDWRNSDPDPNDFAGHGTAIAGVIGARANNQSGGMGAAWRVRLMPLRAAWSTHSAPLGQLDMVYISQAVRYATRNGATVINCSFSSYFQADLAVALDAAHAAGITVVSSAGNSGALNHYIGDRDEVVTVTSSDERDKIPAFANRGNFVDFAAPGTSLIAPTVIRAGTDSIGARQSTYTRGASGTSFSAALTSGVVALLQARRLALGEPPMPPVEVLMRLMETADDISAQNSGLTGYGSGRLNAYRALTDPPTSSVLLPSATMVGPAVPVGGSTVHGAAVALDNGRLALIDVAARDISRTIDLPGAPVGGIAAALLGGNHGFGMFVATDDGGISGFDDRGDALLGWPVVATTNNTAGAMPALGDLDGDGTVEVLWGGSDGSIYAWSVNGEPVAGFPVHLDDGTANGCVALSDLDGAPGVEIAAMSSAGSLFVLGGDGQIKPGWPIVFQVQPVPPAITRFRSGDDPLIIVAMGPLTYAYTAAAERRWTYYQASATNSEAVIGDMNGDGVEEVITSRVNPTELLILDANGLAVRWPGWPRKFAVSPAGTPLMGHIASRPTVVWTVPSSGVYAYDSSAIALPGWPKPGRATGNGCMYDFDGDGRTEIIGGPVGRKGVVIYQLGAHTWSDRPQEWPTLRANAARTGSTLYDPGLTEVTPVLISLAEASATSEAATLEWRLGGDRIDRATLERRVDDGAWSPRARLIPDGSGSLRYEDREVEPGRRYGYRLALTLDGRPMILGEVELEIPRIAVLALAGARPHPTSGPLRVAFTLPDGTPARLEAFDLAGRRVAHVDVGPLGAGSHVVTLGGRLAPGVYSLRLVHGNEIRTARCAVVR